MMWEISDQLRRLAVDTDREFEDISNQIKRPPIRTIHTWAELSLSNQGNQQAVEPDKASELPDRVDWDFYKEFFILCVFVVDCKFVSCPEFWELVERLGRSLGLLAVGSQ